jgi:DNA-binding MarR family transcriptional regulator
MSLEQDIQQASWRNEHQKSLVNLIYTYNWVKDQLNDILDRVNLTMQQYNILRILRGSKVPISTLRIRERMLDKMSDTSRIVDRLVLKGFVTKAVSKADKRLVDIAIAEKGLSVLATIDSFSKEMDGIMGSMSEHDAKTFNALLDRIRK